MCGSLCQISDWSQLAWPSCNCTCRCIPRSKPTKWERLLLLRMSCARRLGLNHWYVVEVISTTDTSQNKKHRTYVHFWEIISPPPFYTKKKGGGSGKMRARRCTCTYARLEISLPCAWCIGVHIICMCWYAFVPLSLCFPAFTNPCPCTCEQQISCGWQLLLKRTLHN